MGDGFPLVSATGTGEALPTDGSSFVLRARSDQTGGAYTLIESSLMDVGTGPGLHVHSREDETFVVLDGRYRFFVGDDEVVGERGAVVFTPRHTPHRFEVASVGSRLLHLFTPGGIDDYFRRNYPAIQSGRLDELAAEFGIRFLD